MAFDRQGSYSIDDEVGRNVIIFGVYMSSSLHIDNKKKYILILDKGPTQGLEHCIQSTLLKTLYKILFKLAL